MTYYLAELHLSRLAGRDLVGTGQRLESAAGEGAGARYVRSIFVPDDETCFSVFEASSPEAVRHVLGLAQLYLIRVSEALVHA